MASPFEALLGMGAQAQARSTPAPPQSPDQVIAQARQFQQMGSEARNQARADQDQAMQQAQFEEQQRLAPLRRRQIEAALEIQERQNFIEDAIGPGLRIAAAKNQLTAQELAAQRTKLELDATRTRMNLEDKNLSDANVVETFVGQYLDNPGAGLEAARKDPNLTGKQKLGIEAILKGTALGKAQEEKQAADLLYWMDLEADDDLNPPIGFQGDARLYRVHENAERNYQEFRRMVDTTVPEERRARFNIPKAALVDHMGRVLPKYQRLLDMEISADLRKAGTSNQEMRNVPALVGTFTRAKGAAEKQLVAIDAQISQAAALGESTTELEETRLRLQTEVEEYDRDIRQLVQIGIPSLSGEAAPVPEAPKAPMKFDWEATNTAVLERVRRAIGDDTPSGVALKSADYLAFKKAFEGAPPSAKVPVVNPENRSGQELVALGNLLEVLKQPGWVVDFEALKEKQKPKPKAEDVKISPAGQKLGLRAPVPAQPVPRVLPPGTVLPPAVTPAQRMAAAGITPSNNSTIASILGG